MLTPTYYLLHVANPAASARFYAAILGAEPVDASETFVLFVLEKGVKLGLWSAATVRPATGGAAGNLEVGIEAGSAEVVDQRLAAWKAAGATVLQEPEDMEFGRSAMIADPDGHRIRLFHVVM
jgi:catechol 2,3-dioxygenase-like lactoylglutathione lyase family enzyme